ncbi:MAG TPA: hypothetical protein VHX44_10960 [Planctomycetota bacterium]|nr:hypothetical protein [Planctomycetota bacterium]
MAPLKAGDDPRMKRLRAAWPVWKYLRNDHGTLLVPKGTDDALDDCGDPIDCFDGLRWHPPKELPTLQDLAREEMPQPSVRFKLRRFGTVSVPLGVGPVYGSGRKRGQPSSELGRLTFDLFARGQDKAREWTDADERDVERLLMLAFQAGYSLTDELFTELSPYDADEAEPLLNTIWGSDPKALASDGPTSPPSPQASSATPG